MIAVQTQPTEHVLRALLAERPPSLPDLADSLDLSLLELLDAIESIEPQLASLSAMTAHQIRIHNARAQRIAIDTLAEIAADSEADPIERRRAATAVLRAAGTRTATGLPPIPGTTGGSPTSAPHPHIPALPADPEPLAKRTLRALAINDDPAPDTGLATLHEAFAPGATLNDEPVADDLDDFLDDLDDDTRDALTGYFQHIIDPPKQTDDTYDQRIALYHKGRCHTAHLHLRPDQPDTPPDSSESDAPPRAPWRIHTLTIKPIDTGFG